MRITIDTKWFDSIQHFDNDMKVVFYEAIFNYLCGNDLNLTEEQMLMFKMLSPMLDEERDKRIRLAERSRANGAKGGRKAAPKVKKSKSFPIIPDGERCEKLLSLDKWMEQKTPYLYQNIRLLNQKEFESLCEKYTSAQICDTLQQIENRKDLRKNYTNLYRTLLNWLKNGFGTSNE